jgi:PKD repeat protein
MLLFTTLLLALCSFRSSATWAFRPTFVNCMRLIEHHITCPDGSIFTYHTLIMKQRCQQADALDHNVYIYFGAIPTTPIHFDFVSAQPFSTTSVNEYYADYVATINEYIFSGDPCVNPPTPNPDYEFLKPVLLHYDPDVNDYTRLECPTVYLDDFGNPPAQFSGNGHVVYVTERNPSLTDWWDDHTIFFNSHFTILHCCDPIPQDPEIKDVVNAGLISSCIVNDRGNAYIKLTINNSVGGFFNSTTTMNTGQALYLYYYDPATFTWNYTAILPSHIDPAPLPSTDFEFYYQIPQKVDCYKYFVIADYTSTSGHSYDHFIDVPFDESEVKMACPCCHADFSYSVSTSSPHDVTFIPAVTDLDYSYNWTLGDGGTSTSPYGLSNTYATPGNYIVCLEVKSEHDDCKKCIGICVKDPDKSCREGDFTYTIGTAGAPPSVTLIPDNPNTSYSYTWEITDVTTTAVITYTSASYGTSIILPSLDDEYRFCVKVYDQNHRFICEKCIGACPLNTNPGDGHGDGKRMASSTNYTGAPELNIYPNPAADNTNLEFSIAEDAMVNIEVKDALGKTVYTQNNVKLTAGKQSISLPTQSLASGLYHVVANSGKWTITKRLSVIK